MKSHTIISGFFLYLALWVHPGISLAKSSGVGRVYVLALASARPDDPPMMRERGQRSAQMVLMAAKQRFPRAFSYNLIEHGSGRHTEFGSSFKEALRALSAELRTDDTVILYTHSHGTPQGLLVDGRLSWRDYGEALLSLPAKNVIVFTMSCFSGGLVDYFRSVRSRWEGRALEGRGFLVISAQNASRSAGPVTIGREKMNGLPFAVAQALQFADGYSGRPRDGVLDFDEFSEFVYAVSRSVGSNSRYFNDSQRISSYPQGQPLTSPRR
ncbi:MAG: hypothetical protein KGQ59_06920 [Bdellovibrionales bacterium]|nr:hypothetical protein [Bdellovibrionales bacterium]